MQVTLGALCFDYCGDVLVQVPCEFGPGVGHLPTQVVVAWFTGVSNILGPWIAKLAKHLSVCVARQ